MVYVLILNLNRARVTIDVQPLMTSLLRSTDAPIFCVARQSKITHPYFDPRGMLSATMIACSRVRPAEMVE
jgi:hypothetical protein